jgi:hypothetical protein
MIDPGRLYLYDEGDAWMEHCFRSSASSAAASSAAGALFRGVREQRTHDERGEGTRGLKLQGEPEEAYRGDPLTKA